MTVVCFSSKHRIIASDSRCSEHGAHVTAMKKIYRLKNKALCGFAGDADTRDVRDLLTKASPRKMPTRFEIAALKCEFDALVVWPNGQCYAVSSEYDDDCKDWRGSVDLITEAVVAIGSGYQFAMGALDSGASPVQAVRTACKRDLFCALPVQWEGLDVKGNSDQKPMPPDGVIETPQATTKPRRKRKST